jgi:predicted ArsR family transcriptional regulator
MADRWTAVTALADRSRRVLYEHVRGQGGPVSRDEAAEATAMSRSLVAFHLDKLVEAGLLRARYEAPAGQPRGRGRAPKVYEPAGDGLAISIPARRYELIAEILADAVAADPAHAGRAAARLAHRRGRDLGVGWGQRDASVGELLAELGFEPVVQDGRVVLRNCPFHALAVRQTALVCGLNHAFVTGLVEGLGVGTVEPRLVARPGFCCVELTEQPR